MTETTAAATKRGVAIGLVIAVLALWLWSGSGDRAEAAAPVVTPAALGFQINDDMPTPIVGGWFARYDGIDGESQDNHHDGWVDILGYEWGAERSAATGLTRRRAAPTIDDFVITFDYEKASPKLLEKALRGEVIPKLEIELTATYGGARLTYLRYELKNVLVSSYDVGGVADGGPPTVVIGNNFEEVKVTYTEYDNEGNRLGNVETSYKVDKGQ